MSDINGIEARSKAEHLILSGQPFVLCAMTGKNASSTIIHVGDGTKEERTQNRECIDWLIMNLTNQVHPQIKVM